MPLLGYTIKNGKTLDFESSVEVLRELRSVYKMSQLYSTVVHSMLDLDLKTGVNPLKT